MKAYDHEVFCFEYLGADAEQRANAVWESARDGKIEHCSVWRTTTQARDRWMVVVADQSGQARELIDFGDGVEREMEEREALAFLERRMGRALDGLAHGQTELRDVTRFGRRGAKLLRGGVLEREIGRDQ